MSGGLPPTAGADSARSRTNWRTTKETTVNVWQFIRDNWLSNRVFASCDAIVDHCCDAWNKLTAQPWTIMSLGLRDWAHRS